jgi:hypothetical protein
MTDFFSYIAYSNVNTNSTEGYIMKNEKRKSDHPDYDKFDAASSTECTGLITVPPQNEDELESYRDIYEFDTVIKKGM